jgi:hypothetical protein
MFTAIVLVCAGLDKSIENCYTYTLDVIVPSERDCVLSVKNAIAENYFYYHDESKNITYQITDFQCINWKTERS